MISVMCIYFVVVSLLLVRSNVSGYNKSNYTAMFTEAILMVMQSLALVYG